MKNNINITIQGVKGGTKHQTVGYLLACLRNEQDRISIDDFEGQGNSYKQREQQLITIVENGVTLFEGTKDELFNILKQAKKHP